MAAELEAELKSSKNEFELFIAQAAQQRAELTEQVCGIRVAARAMLQHRSVSRAVQHRVVARAVWQVCNRRN